MDREAVAATLRCVYAYARPLCRAARNASAPPDDAAAQRIVQFHAKNAEMLIEHLETLAREVLGPSFRFEPDMQRTTDATPARMSGLRPVASAQPERPTLSVIPGGAQPDERPSARYIDDEPEAG